MPPTRHRRLAAADCATTKRPAPLERADHAGPKPCAERRVFQQKRTWLKKLSKRISFRRLWWHKFGRTRAKLGRIRARSGRVRVKAGRSQAKFGLMLPNQGIPQSRHPKRTHKFGRCRPDLGRRWQTSSWIPRRPTRLLMPPSRPPPPFACRSPTPTTSHTQRRLRRNCSLPAIRSLPK